MIIDINQESFLSELQKYVGKTGYKFIIRQKDTPEFEISDVFSVEIIKKRKG